MKTLILCNSVCVSGGGRDGVRAFCVCVVGAGILYT